MFDPEKMCWVSTQEDEVDVFEGMADDEDDDPGATITRASGRKLVTIGGGGGGGGWTGRFASESSAGASSSSWEERVVPGIGSGLGGDAALVNECREAEARHRREMRGWSVVGGVEEREEKRRRREEKRLWEIRKEAMGATQ